MKLSNRFILIGIFSILSFVSGLSQTKDSIAVSQDSVPQKITKVFLEHANILSYDKDINVDAQVLVGDVCFRHDSSYMYCDSAYFYEQTNSLEAFSNVRMEQGDTLFVYGNYLFYNGNTQIAYLRENVRMENGQVTLFTDSLNYERIPDIGYYFEGGMIVDSLNQLSSFYGQYSPATKLAVFNDSVRLENPQFTLYSDTLHYDTETKIATILGPSVIVSDSGTIYSSRGWYDTMSNTSLLLDRSQVVSGDRILTGDSIAYDKESGFGEVFGNMSLQDTVKKITLEGQYGYYNEKTEFAFATDSARFLEYSQADTLYLHADTLKMQTVDSLYRDIKAYYGVRFYRTDMQGVCDSMQFNTRDSILYMYTEPILWNEQYQIYGDTILVYMNDSTIDHAHVKEFAFAVQYVDTSYYNQLKGNDLKAYFEGQAVRQIDVAGNAESIFYPLENDGAMVGMNETKSGFLTIWVKDNKLEKLKIWPTPQGTLTPIPDLKPEQKTLKDFYWFDYIRPKNKDDIYQVVKRKVKDAPRRSNKFVH
ncbi:OstA-like protein [Parabacteroides bouchesdurhonensis]|uniref:OstA-like protein n=1 Tax=Parabacteroides bouchesdurhonensis TaxID=1936995 RepID=UPI000C858816|nr:OstA-like protein [Parabacteroides bouchesdurhonensis]